VVDVKYLSRTFEENAIYDKINREWKKWEMKNMKFVSEKWKYRVWYLYNGVIVE
jgi:hypothetical protein